MRSETKNLGEGSERETLYLTLRMEKKKRRAEKKKVFL